MLARQRDLVVLSSLDSGKLVEMLLDLLVQVASSGGDGRRLSDAVADALEIEARVGDGSGIAQRDDGPAVLAFGPAGTGLALTVSGGAWVEVRTAHGVQRIAATQPGVLLRSVVRSPASAVRGGLDSSALADGDSGGARTDRFSRLDGGTVRASGLAFYPAGAASAAGSPPAPVAGSLFPPGRPEPARPEPVWPEPARPEPVPDFGLLPSPEPPASVPSSPSSSPGPSAPPSGPEPEDEGTLEPTMAASFESLLSDVGPTGFDAPGTELAGAEPGGNGQRPGPIIDGVYCPNGHFEDPEASSCTVCGISMNQQTLVPRPGPRPPLGALVLDDGSVFKLDGDYVVGREPTLDDSVASGQASPLLVADPAGIVSRVHARVHLEGWRVLITDLGSANGTRVIRPQQQIDQQLLPKVPVVLSPGSRVDLGGCGFSYESRRGPAGG